MAGRARVLVVDDEQDILKALRSYLEGALDVDVATAASGAEGLEILGQDLPVDLIVSDYRMPGMDGIEFLRKARQSKPDVPRILLTAYPDMQLAIQAVNEAAIMQFLTKPVQPETLLDLVRTALEESRKARNSRLALNRAARLAGGKSDS